MRVKKPLVLADMIGKDLSGFRLEVWFAVSNQGEGGRLYGEHVRFFKHEKRARSMATRVGKSWHDCLVLTKDGKSGILMEETAYANLSR